MSLTKLTVDDMKEMLIPDAAHMSCAPEELKAVLGSQHRNKYEEKLGRAAAMVQCFCNKTIERYRRLLNLQDCHFASCTARLPDYRCTTKNDPGGRFS